MWKISNRKIMKISDEVKANKNVPKKFSSNKILDFDIFEELWKIIVLPFFEDLKISKSMRNILNRNTFKVTFNSAFEEVIKNCKEIYRPDQGSTWITNEMQQAYINLHKLGFAKSVEVWQNDKLVGGLYGVDLGHIFCGESMFSKVSNASKLAFIALAKQLELANYRLLDCQVYNEHLDSLGCVEIDREDFLQVLKS